MRKTVFERNIEALKSEKLKQILLEIGEIKSDIKPISTNGYNLAYNGVPLHNTKSPLGEAKVIFDSLGENLASITIVFGIGLGYLFQYTVQNSKGIVVLYETNLDILKTAFSYVDFSAEIASERVEIAINHDSLKAALRKHMSLRNYPNMIILPSYREIFPEMVKQEMYELNTLVGGILMDSNYIRSKFYDVTCSILKNIPHLIKEIPLSNIKNIYEGKTAVVCSAGPTLYENIETIKKYRNNIVLICVGPAARALINAGIYPDFLCIIENKDCSSQLYGLDLSKTYMILEPYTNIKFHQQKAKKIFSHVSVNLQPNYIWSTIANINRIDYCSRGTVSYCALNSARILGCKKIVLAGQDLAFLDGEVYSKNSAYKNLKLKFNDETQKYEVYVDNMEEFAQAVAPNADKETQQREIEAKLNQYRNKITTIKSITGELIPTEIVYSTFANHISEFAEEFPNIEYINTSLRGAEIKNYKNMPLDDALKDTAPFEKKDLKNIPAFDKNKIIDGVNNIIEELKPLKQKNAEVKKLLSKFRREYFRHKKLTKEMLIILKQLIVNYTCISIEYAQEHPMIEYITKKEQMDFEKYLNHSEEIDLNTALKMAKLLSEYLQTAEEHIDEVTEIINNVCVEINNGGE